MTTRLLVGMLTPAIRAMFFSSPCGPDKPALFRLPRVRWRPALAGVSSSKRLPCPCGQAKPMPDRKTGRHTAANRLRQVQSLISPRCVLDHRFDLPRHRIDVGHAVDAPELALGTVVANQRRRLLVVL